MYLDDIIIFSATFEEHTVNTGKVLQRLREHGVKLKSRNCKLFKREVTFLGHFVSLEGYKQLDPSSIKHLSIKYLQLKTLRQRPSTKCASLCVSGPITAEMSRTFENCQAYL